MISFFPKNSWTSIGYFSNSTCSFVSSSQFSPIHCDMRYSNAFLHVPTSCRIWKSRWWLAKSKSVVPIGLISFGVHMNTLFVIMLIEWSYMSPQSHRPSSLEWLAYFACIVPFETHVFILYPFLDPHLVTYHLNIGVQISAMFDIAQIFYVVIWWMFTTLTKGRVTTKGEGENDEIYWKA